MSQTFEKIKNAVKFKSGESTSSKKVQSWTVRDSRPCRNRMTNNYATGTFTGLIAFLVIGGSLLSSGQQAYADDSLTVSISGNPSVNISPSSEGTFADSGDITIGVSNAPATGYTLAITGTSNTSLTGKTDSTKSITSIASAIDQSAFSSNSDYNNMWGYKPSMYYNSSTETRANNSNYLPVPGATADIIDITDNSDSNNYTLSIGARVTNTLGFQTYESNTFTIAAVPNVTTDYLQITYDANGGYFGSDTSKTTNLVSYDAVGEIGVTKGTITKILHSDNVGDDGVATGNSATNTDQTKEATIEGADSVNVTLYYDTEGISYDWVALYSGTNSTPSNTNDATKGSNGNLTGKLGGNKSDYTTSYTTWNVWDNGGNPINSDTIKVHFKTDNTAGNYISYGYYAIITGETETESIITPYSKTVASGTYAVPNNNSEDVAGFLGWSEDSNATKATYADETEVSTNLRSTNGGTEVTLYAIWKPSVKSTNMQGWADCSNMSIGDTITLTDSRDNNEYIVGKLADEKCWMLDNLRLDPTSTDLATLKGNTNANDQALTYFKNGGGYYSSTSKAVSNNWVSSEQDSFDLPYINIDSKDTKSEYAFNSTSGSGKIGVYYNYCAATAGTYCYASGAGSGNASSDICPSGWHIPSGGSSGEYQNLLNSYSNFNLFRSAFSTVNNGEFYSGTIHNPYMDYVWSSTSYNGTSMYRLFDNGAEVRLSYASRKYAASVRCVAGS